jgi:hypothetical protein
VTGVSLEELTDTAHLDWHDLACGWTDCPHTAAWWLVCLACRFHQPFCDTHRRDLAAQIPQGPFDLVYCPECLVHRPAARAFEHFAFVPIGV